jgi:hypothetical protein
MGEIALEFEDILNELDDPDAILEAREAMEEIEEGLSISSIKLKIDRRDLRRVAKGKFLFMNPIVVFAEYREENYFIGAFERFEIDDFDNAENFLEFLINSLAKEIKR